ncbi:MULTISPECIES: RidA family protein [unclassified Brenneria]|uniref:RidA family protein n=1 Tax=unclassified Brenneria TaxID=2634434 RepID=UPI00155752A3|nr:MULTISPECIES: RidA family protein [unclassified Brenneria]MBJ7220369.1 RidA family protein [Brenneria sp. L3-3C-1]MEE3641614.1 RidA family protein [Brenneria sp. L3_3C_1]MEE3649755.1 RidA family protein [Brenneria sp. HEZEL_4_2_4]NPC99714.1 RidA family protein [Brenneria sp. hezel4-2-4]
MNTQIVINNADNAPPPGGHYSHSCTAGGFVWISGQLPIKTTGEKQVAAPFEEQVRQVLSNLDACLVGAGVSRKELVSVRVYVTDISLWPAFNTLYADWIGDARPSRVVAGVSELHYGAAVEVEAVALATVK